MSHRGSAHGSGTLILHGYLHSACPSIPFLFCPALPSSQERARDLPRISQRGLHSSYTCDIVWVLASRRTASCDGALEGPAVPLSIRALRNTQWSTRGWHAHERWAQTTTEERWREHERDSGIAARRSGRERDMGRGRSAQRGRGPGHRTLPEAPSRLAR